MTLVGQRQWKKRGKVLTTVNRGANVNEHVKTTLCKLLFLDFGNLESRNIVILSR